MQWVSSHISPPPSANWYSSFSLVSKSINSGAPASSAPADFSSLGIIASQSDRIASYCLAAKYFGVYLPAGAAAFSLCTIWWASSAASSGITCRTEPPATPTAKVLSTSLREIPCVVILCSLFPAASHLLIHYKLPFFASSSKYSDARQESAMIVRVGFLSGLVTKGAPSVTKTFFTSCVWQ